MNSRNDSSTSGAEAEGYRVLVTTGNVSEEFSSRQLRERMNLRANSGP